MKKTSTDDLLNEILTGEDLAEFRQSAYERGLTALRVRRRRQQITRAVMLASTPVLALAIFFSTRLSEDTRSTRVASTTSAAPAPSPSKAAHREGPALVKNISDQELLALFPNRAVALIGPPGRQQLVFLDEVRHDANL